MKLQFIENKFVREQCRTQVHASANIVFTRGRNGMIILHTEPPAKAFSRQRINYERNLYLTSAHTSCNKYEYNGIDNAI